MAELSSSTELFVISVVGSKFTILPLPSLDIVGTVGIKGVGPVGSLCVVPFGGLSVPVVNVVSSVGIDGNDGSSVVSVSVAISVSASTACVVSLVVLLNHLVVDSSSWKVMEETRDFM